MDETPRPPEPAPTSGPTGQTAATDPFADAPRAPGPYTSWTTPHQGKPPSNGWKVATIVLSVIMGLGLLGIGGFVALGVYVVSQEVTSFELDDGIVDACEDLGTAAADLDPAAGASDEALAGLAEAARAVADDADRSATDSTADQDFVRDAADLADALEAFADDPDAGFTVPRRDDTPVTVLMSRSAMTCPVPPVVTALDPEAGSDLYVDEPFAF